MGMFRKKPVLIEAWQNAIGKEKPIWLLQALTDDVVEARAKVDRMVYAIKTLEGVMIADHGDWIIKGVKGELYPCKPDIFAATYDAA